MVLLVLSWASGMLGHDSDSISTGCLKMLWNLHLWRYSEAVWMLSW